MLQYALSKTDELISIHSVQAGPYFCPDCKAPLGKKLGPERIWHFFHLGEETLISHTCKKKGEHTQHKALQYFLQKKLLSTHTPPIEIEYPLFQAKRIADLALVQERIAIELQRSPLSFDAVLDRSESYYKEGWQVLWLFHASLWQENNLGQQIENYAKIPFYLFEEKGGQLTLWDTFPSIPPRELSSFVLKKRLPTAIPLLQKRKEWRVHMEGDFVDNPPSKKEGPPKNLLSRTTLLLKLFWFKFLT